MFRHKKMVACGLFLLSWGYLIYKLCAFDDYDLLCDNLKQLPAPNYALLAFVLLLMPLNFSLEVWKWHCSVKQIKQQSFHDSFRQVLLGNAGAFITPFRLGEHPSRAYYIKEQNEDSTNNAIFLSAIVLGFIGSIALDIINVGLGLPAAVLYFSEPKITTMMITYSAILLIVIILFLLLPKICILLNNRNTKNQQTKYILNTIGSLKISFLLKLVLQSLLRYAVYSMQLYLALRFFDINLSLSNALVAIPTYYMLVSVTPSLPVADAAIRGSWGMVVFQAYSFNSPSIAFAVMLIWVVNTAIPLLAVPFVKSK